MVQRKGRLDSGRGKQRVVYFSDRIRRSLQRYLSELGEPEPSHTCVTLKPTKTMTNRRLAAIGFQMTLLYSGYDLGLGDSGGYGRMAKVQTRPIQEETIGTFPDEMKIESCTKEAS